MGGPYFELRKLTEEGYVVRISAPTFTIEILDGDKVVSKAYSEFYADAITEAWLSTPDREAMTTAEDQRLRASGAPELPGMEFR